MRFESLGITLVKHLSMNLCYCPDCDLQDEVFEWEKNCLVCGAPLTIVEENIPNPDELEFMGEYEDEDL